MQIECILEVSHENQEILTETYEVTIDERMIEQLLVRYVRENYGSDAKLDLYVIDKVCMT